MRAVLDEVGYAGALLARETPEGLMLIDGHLRSEVTPDETVPVLVLDVDEAETKKILATFDPISAMAEADKGKLDAVLRDIDTGSEALAKMLEDLAESNGLLEQITTEEGPEPQIDKAAEMKAKWGTELGQLWKIGEHRLLCGDARDPFCVERVMAGEKASCIFTDPPYGVGIGAKNRLLNSVQEAGRALNDIEDDNLTPEELKARLLPAFVNARKIAMAEDCTLFMTAPQGGELGMMMMMMMAEAGLPIRHVLIWMKNSPTFSMGRLDYDYQHEPILLTWGKRHKRPMRGEHRTSVWQIDKPRASDVHPTMKPVALVANALLNNSDKGDVVYEPYSGSGTCLIACEQLRRKCRAIDKAPEFVAVALQRCTDAGMSCRLENRDG
jgi:DNA modification methylase